MMQSNNYPYRRAIDQKTLKSVLHYNPQIGVFTWKKRTGQRIRAGAIAGSIVPTGYIVVGVNYINYRAHRLAWLYVYGEFPKDQIDHINHIKTDNRISNLRAASRQENQRNRKLTKNSITGCLGVRRRDKRNIWEAQIRDGQKQKYLGTFKDFFEACCARKSAENKYGFHKNHGGLNLENAK